MTLVITAPHSIDVNGFKVFLAGAIDMGEAPNWQAEAIRLIGEHPELVVFNPRRATDFTSDTLDEQIAWELHALTASDAILMWFPRAAEAPISFLETGLFMTSGKLILGAEEGFYRRRNLELTAQFYNVPLWDTLEAITNEALQRYKTKATGQIE